MKFGLDKWRATVRLVSGSGFTTASVSAFHPAASHRLTKLLENHCTHDLPRRVVIPNCFRETLNL